MKQILKSGMRAAAAVLFAALALPAAADDTDLVFTLEISGSVNTPTLTVTNNSPVLEFNRMVFHIGDTAFNFDARSTYKVVAPVGGTAAQFLPLPPGQSDVVDVSLTGFGPGKTFTVDLDMDRDGLNSAEDYRAILFNNNAANATITLYSGPRNISLQLPDPPAGQASYTFNGPLRVLRVQSIAETNGTDYVRVVDVKVDGVVVGQNIGELTTFQIPAGSDVEISAPRKVYKDINGADITTSVENEPELIEANAEERFTALGISVNDVPQTGDPALYRFELTEDTQVEVKWEQEFALTVRSDFANTQSTTIVNGEPLAGPLTSQASGTPAPAAQKHWIKRGEPRIAQIDGAVADLLAQPGLDIRYVVQSYVAYGPANSLMSPQIASERLADSDGGNLESAYGGPKTITAYAGVTGNPPGIMQVTVSGHGLSSGMRVRIAGAGLVEYNGDHVVTRVSANAFTIPVTFISNPATKGTALRLVDNR